MLSIQHRIIVVSGSPGENTARGPTRSALVALEKQSWEEECLKSHLWVSRLPFTLSEEDSSRGWAFSSEVLICRKRKKEAQPHSLADHQWIKATMS